MLTSLPYGRACTAVAGAALLLSAPGVAHAAPTRAGTPIENTATATFDQGGGEVTVQSNTVTFKVDEVIDPTVSWTDGTPITTTPGALASVFRFRLTNSGNGAESFSLSTNANIAGDQFNPVVVRLVLDLNDNGTYDPATDTIYLLGTNDPTLEPGASIGVLAITTTPTSALDGQRGNVSLIATSRTGTGAPGTTFANAGEGGGTAVLGSNGGDDDAVGISEVSAASVALTKSAVVLNSFGPAEAIPGASITYTIVATASGSGSVSGLEVRDAIPAGTTYVPGSLRLGTTALTDAADSDAGSFAANAVLVTLGTVPAGDTRSISFKVTVNAN